MTDTVGEGMVYKWEVLEPKLGATNQVFYIEWNLSRKLFIYGLPSNIHIKKSVKL